MGFGTGERGRPQMRKTIKLDGEICPNCAGKIQAKIEGLDGVNSVSVNALTLKFILDAEDAKFDDLLGQYVKIFADVEPDCEVLV